MVILMLSALLALSLSANVYLHLKRLRVTRPQPSLELREFMGDLTRGEAVVRVSRIDPADIFLRSPRERRS